MDAERMERIFAEVEAWAGSPENGLPKELFEFLTRLVPMINVDLLIVDERLGTLLTWRHDENYGPGWHLPGGIIRYKETAEARVRKTAERELEVGVEFEPVPIAIEHVVSQTRRERGHMISFLYRCRLAEAPPERLRLNPVHPEAGQWEWHRGCPVNLIPEHDHYRKFI
jgi:colanic acid biosynthesis protein WcaH